MDTVTWIIIVINFILALVAVGAIIHNQWWNKRNEEMRFLPFLYPDPEYYPSYREGAAPGWLKSFSLRVINGGQGAAASYEITVSQGENLFVGRTAGPIGKTLSCGLLAPSEVHHFYYSSDDNAALHQETPEPIIVHIRASGFLGQVVEMKYELRLHHVPKHGGDSTFLDKPITLEVLINGRKRNLPKLFKKSG